MTADTEVVVIGAGVVGAATAYALARAGRAVTIVEQFEPGHGRGSSHGRSRIHRIGYPDVEWARRAAEADALWIDVERECGEELIERIGVLDAGEVAGSVAEALAACGVEHERIDGREAARRWPISFEPGEVVTYQPGGGICRADRALAALLDGAVAAGADLVTSTTVVALERHDDRVAIGTSHGTLDASVVVVTAGGWVRGLLEPLGIPIPVRTTRETVAYFSLPRGAELPSFIDYAWTGGPDDGLAETGMAGFALAAPGVGLKAGLHKSGHDADPSSSEPASDAVVAWTERWVRHRYGDAAGAAFGAETCLYTRTADDDFLVERHGRVVVGSACSGHGFKFAPLVGRQLAALATDALDA